MDIHFNFDSSEIEASPSLSLDGPALKQATPSRKVELKLATEDDWPEVLKMCRDFHAFSPYRDVPFRDDRVRLLFDCYRKSPSDFICILATQGNVPKGMIFGAVSKLYFSDEEVAGEIIWWVNPDARRTRAGVMLHDAFVYWAKHKTDAKFLQFTNTEGTTDLEKFYRKHNYSLVETTFIKELR